jgi:hypothetical protein
MELERTKSDRSAGCGRVALLCVLAMAGFMTMLEPHQIGDPPKPAPGPTHPSPSPSPRPSPQPGGPGPTDPSPPQPIPPSMFVR